MKKKIIVFITLICIIISAITYILINNKSTSEPNITNISLNTDEAKQLIQKLHDYLGTTDIKINKIEKHEYSFYGDGLGEEKLTPIYNGIYYEINLENNEKSITYGYLPSTNSFHEVIVQDGE